MSDLRVGAGLTVPSALKRWTGSAFVDVGSAHVWDGSKFVKVWPNAQPVAFDNAATGAYTGFTHTATSGADVIVLVADYVASTPTLTVTYDGVAMTPLASRLTMPPGVPYGTFLAAFRATNVAGGAKTVAVTGGSGTGQVAAISYLNVGTVTASSKDLASNPVYDSLTPATDGIVLIAAGGFSFASLSSITGGTQRANISDTVQLMVNDAATATTFTTTSSSNNPQITLQLAP